MGYKEMDYVWDKSQATKTDKLVLLAIARRYTLGKGSWPSQSHLAKVCGISARSVRRSISALQALGELKWVSGNDKSKKANLYYITLLEGAKMFAIEEPDLSADSAKMSAISDKNVRLLDKELYILDKQKIVKFDASRGGALHLASIEVSGLSPLRVESELEAFADSWQCKKAYTEDMRLTYWWTYLDNAKREDK
jgi:hypothetical protein